jgi:hypothetical protein
LKNSSSSATPPPPRASSVRPIIFSNQQVIVQFCKS